MASDATSLEGRDEFDEVDKIADGLEATLQCGKPMWNVCKPTYIICMYVCMRENVSRDVYKLT